MLTLLNCNEEYVLDLVGLYLGYIPLPLAVDDDGSVCLGRHL